MDRVVWPCISSVSVHVLSFATYLYEVECDVHTSFRISKSTISLDEPRPSFFQQFSSLRALLHVLISQVHQALDVIYADNGPGRCDKVRQDVSEIARPRADIENARGGAQEGKEGLACLRAGCLSVLSVGIDVRRDCNDRQKRACAAQR